MTGIDWEESILNAFANIWGFITISQSVPGILYILLSLTPSLWSDFALIWLETMWDAFMLGSNGVPGGMRDLIDAYGGHNKTRCMFENEIQAAILSPDTSVSGWYGPGAYLAWLITSWTVAISSIASAKLASRNPQRHELDPELIAVVFYPLVAAMDIIIRLFRCKIDVSMTAALFVIVTSLSILSPIKRLSTQQEGSHGANMMDDLNNSDFLERKRGWTVRIPRWTAHAIIGAVAGEAYANRPAIFTLWGLLFLTVLYSGVVGNYENCKGHSMRRCRPWQERVAFFIGLQVIFSVVLVRTGGRSFWPQTSASLFDLDQAATLVAALIVLLFLRGKTFVALLLKEVTGWLRPARAIEDEEIPLTSVSAAHDQEVSA